MLKQLMAGAAAVAVLIGTGSALGDEGGLKLKIGDPAPKLADVSWVKGDPVSEYSSGQIYVLDFWATWCGPCKQAIPHMNDVHNAHKKDGVNVIGVAVWPKPTMVPTKDFVAQKGDEMAYRIAEDKDGATAKTFMEGTGQGGIPTVMIVDRAGKLAWIGHPANGMDDALKEIISGTYDLAKASKKFETEAAQEMKAQSLNKEMRAAINDKNFEKQIGIADRMLETDPQNFSQAAFFKYRVLLTELGNAKGAASWGRQVLDGPLSKNADMLNALAWFIVDSDKLKDSERDADLALAAAKKANDVTEGKEWMILDTLAHAYFLKGDTTEAIRTERKALELATDADAKQDLQKSLEKFEKTGAKS